MTRDLARTSTTVFGVLALCMATSAAVSAQGTRSSGSGASGNPLYDIAVGLDPLTGQAANTPFTAPTSLAGGINNSLPPLVSTTGAQPIFISDSELAATSGFNVPSGFATPGANFAVGAGTGFPTAAGIGTQSLTPDFGFVDTAGASTPYFVSDAELSGGAASFGTTPGGNAAFGAFGTSDAIVGRLPGELPVVGPEYSNEIPGMGLSVVKPIQTVSSLEAEQIAANIASGNTGFATSGVGGTFANVPTGLPTPGTRRAPGTPYISGNLAAVRLGIGTPASDNPIANPGPVSPITPSTSTDNLNAPVQDGQPTTFSTLAVDEQPAPAPAPTPVADAPAPAPADTGTPAAAGCAGPVVIQFTDDAKELSDTHKQRLRALVAACRSDNPDAVYGVVGYPDQAMIGNATARQIPGARLFDLRFFMVESGISAQNLDLSTGQDTSQFNNALVVSIE